VKQKLPPDDLRLWKINTRDVKPLAKVEQKTEESPDVPSLPKKHTLTNPARAQKSVAPLPPAPPPSLGRKELRRLKIEARFDMHGLSLKAGYDALEEFLRHAQGKGIKTVLVITGKGSMSAENTLRRQLPRWVEDTPLRQLVSALHHPAKLQDGGSGAFYVEVRREGKSRRTVKEQR
jgi:DNA-nicking Smr family endonuclease